MLLKQTVVDNKRCKRNRRKTHSAQIVLPVTDFLGIKAYMSIFYVVQTSRNVLNLNCFRLVRSKFDQITFKGKLLRIGIDYSDHHFEICWILQFSFDKSRHSEWRFDVIENSGWLGMTLEVKLIKNLADFRVNEANRSFFLANFQGQILQIVVV